uniref:Uncharacterized protein n=1 Tax=Arundo donax TaxID=35708 RepID=A0A0A8ZV63_ARUDO
MFSCTSDAHACQDSMVYVSHVNSVAVTKILTKTAKVSKALQ